MGCAIQRLVYAHIHVSGGERARIYWEEKGGKETVRNTFRRKRQAAQNAMKLAFRGKFLCCSVTATLVVGLVLNC